MLDEIDYIEEPDDSNISRVNSLINVTQHHCLRILFEAIRRMIARQLLHFNQQASEHSSKPSKVSPKRTSALFEEEKKQAQSTLQDMPENKYGENTLLPPINSSLTLPYRPDWMIAGTKINLRIVTKIIGQFMVGFGELGVAVTKADALIISVIAGYPICTDLSVSQ